MTHHQYANGTWVDHDGPCPGWHREPAVGEVWQLVSDAATDAASLWLQDQRRNQQVPRSFYVTRGWAEGSRAIEARRGAADRRHRTFTRRDRVEETMLAHLRAINLQLGLEKPGCDVGPPPLYDTAADPQRSRARRRGEENTGIAKGYEGQIIPVPKGPKGSTLQRVVGWLGGYRG